MRLPLMRPLLGTWPATQACALTGNQSGNPLVRRLVLNPLSHTNQESERFCHSNHLMLQRRVQVTEHVDLQLLPVAPVGALAP